MWSFCCHFSTWPNVHMWSVQMDRSCDAPILYQDGILQKKIQFCFSGEFSCRYSAFWLAQPSRAADSSITLREVCELLSLIEPDEIKLILALLESAPALTLIIHFLQQFSSPGVQDWTLLPLVSTATMEPLMPRFRQNGKIMRLQWTEERVNCYPLWITLIQRIIKQGTYKQTSDRI